MQHYIYFIVLLYRYRDKRYKSSQIYHEKLMVHCSTVFRND